MQIWRSAAALWLLAEIAHASPSALAPDRSAPAAGGHRAGGIVLAQTEFARSRIGVRIQDVTPETAKAYQLKEVRGGVIVYLHPEGPAAKAGLRTGDVIVAVDRQRVTTVRDIARRIGEFPPGTAIEIGFVREGAEQVAKLIVDEWMTAPSRP